MDTVTGVDQDRLIDDLSDLVCLEMSDHMESRILRDLRTFFRDLLHLVFTEITLPGLISFHQHGNRLRLADGDQGNFLRVSSRTKAGRIHAFSHIFYILCN